MSQNPLSKDCTSTWRKETIEVKGKGQDEKQKQRQGASVRKGTVLTLIALWVLSFFTNDRSQMQAACLTCGLGLMMCLFKMRSRTQGTTSFTFKSI